MRLPRAFFVVPAVAALVMALTGCADVCPSNLIIGKSGVDVVIAGKALTDALTVQVCVADHCTSATAQGSATPVFVANPKVSKAPIVAEVTVRTIQGAELVHAERVQATPVRGGQPDPRCGPSFFVATVRVKA